MKSARPSALFCGTTVSSAQGWGIYEAESFSALCEEVRMAGYMVDFFLTFVFVLLLIWRFGGGNNDNNRKV